MAISPPGVQKFSALSLLPFAIAMMAVGQVRFKSLFPKSEFENYIIAIAYPLVVMFLLITLIIVTGNLVTKEEAVSRVVMVVAINSFFGILAALLSEELFFRGVCWQLLEREKYSSLKVNLFTSVLFTVWHLPVGFYEFGAFSKAQLPI